MKESALKESIAKVPGAQSQAAPPAKASEAKPQSAKPIASGNAAEGKALYEAKCSVCHQPDLAGKPPIFPSLQGIIQRKGEAHTRSTITNGVPDARPMMPAFGDRITSEDIDNLVAFLRTVKAQAPASEP